MKSKKLPCNVQNNAAIHLGKQIRIWILAFPFCMFQCLYEWLNFTFLKHGIHGLINTECFVANIGSKIWGKAEIICPHACANKA